MTDIIGYVIKSASGGMYLARRNSPCGLWTVDIDHARIYPDRESAQQDLLEGETIVPVRQSIREIE